MTELNLSLSLASQLYTFIFRVAYWTDLIPKPTTTDSVAEPVKAVPSGERIKHPTVPSSSQFSHSLSTPKKVLGFSGHASPLIAPLHGHTTAYQPQVSLVQKKAMKDKDPLEPGALGHLSFIQTVKEGTEGEPLRVRGS